MSEVPRTQIDLLRQWRFQHLGCFRLYDTICQIEPAPDLANRDTVYAFVQGDRVMYVGSADEPKRRLRDYIRSHANAEKKRLVHRGLREVLEGQHVDIWVRQIYGSITVVDGLPVGMLLGVEDGIIKTLQPPWNGRGKAKPILNSPSSASQAEVAELLRLVQEIRAQMVV